MNVRPMDFQTLDVVIFLKIGLKVNKQSPERRCSNPDHILTATSFITFQELQKYYPTVK